MTDFDFSNPPVEFSELDSEQGKKWNEQCCSLFYDEGYVRLGKIKGVYARNYVRSFERIRDFKVLPDDVWVVSFPKCGTTWTQEMVWCIMNDLDFEGAKVGLQKRFPYFELRANWSPSLAKLIRESVLEGTKAAAAAETSDSNGSASNVEEEERNVEFFLNSFDLVENLPRPRFVKSHLHYSLLPEGLKNENSPKMIYVARNPKDACTSFYHHSCLLDGYKGNMEDFVDAFTSENVFCAPFWTHLREFWEIRDRKNVLYLKYEDMKKDLPSIIRQTADFLGKTLTEEQVNILEKHLSFDSMKNNPSVNYEDIVGNMRKMHGTAHDSKFMRKGKVGSWKDEMTPEMVAKLDAWINANKIEGLYES